MATSEAVPAIDAVVFDLGGVLMDWNPRHLYRKLFGGDDKAMERFLTTVCTSDWIREQEIGLPVADAVARLSRRFPAEATLIEAFDTRWAEMLAGPIPGSVAILEELRECGRPTYGLTNLPAEKYPILQRALEFLDTLQGVIVSGAVGTAKPAPEIYLHLSRTFKLVPFRTLYVDDVKANVDAAKALGFPALHFVSPEKLRADLTALEVI